MTTRSAWYQSMSLYQSKIILLLPAWGSHSTEYYAVCSMMWILINYNGLFFSQRNGAECIVWIVTESCPMGSQSSFNASFGDTITVSCSINYTGSAVPVLQLSSGSGAVSTDCSSSGRVCSSLSVNVRSGMTTVESRTCSVTFPQTVRVHPHCSSWNSTQITVSCK